MEAIEQLDTTSPDDSIVRCPDEIEPEAAKGFAGQKLVRPAPKHAPAERAMQGLE
jgi:hypothetical protein